MNRRVMEIYIRHFKNKKERNEAIKVALLLVLGILAFCVCLMFLFGY